MSAYEVLIEQICISPVSSSQRRGSSEINPYELQKNSLSPQSVSHTHSCNYTNGIPASAGMTRTFYKVALK